MRIKEIVESLNEGTTMSAEKLAEYNSILEAPGSKFNVYVEVLQEDRDSSLIFKKAFSATDAKHAKSKAERELKRYFSGQASRIQIPGWTNMGQAVDGIQYYYDEDEFYQVHDVKPITGSKKKGASPYDLNDSVRAYSQSIAKALHGRQQSEWFHADLDGLAYDGNEAKEEALEAANRFAPIYFEGEDRYFVDAKVYNNDGDMGWIWTLAPKAEV